LTVDDWGKLWALMSGLLWAVAVILFKKAGENAPPLVLNLFKSVVALVCLGPVLLIQNGIGIPDWSGRIWVLLAISGFVGVTLADTVFFMALNRLGAGMNAIVDCSYAPSMVTMAVLYLGEKPTTGEFAGGALIVGGILVGSVTRPAPGRTRRDLVVGLLLGLFGMLLISSSVVMVKEYLDPKRPETILPMTMFRLLVGTIALAPIAAARSSDRRASAALFRPSHRWKTAVPGSILGAALAMWAWIAGFTFTDVTTASLLNQFSTIYIFILAIAVLKEPLTRRRLAALVLAFGGAILVVLSD
jgi:drug/metabolite transporter (DMT)-like permease